MREEKIKYNRDEKYDLQLSSALIEEKKLGLIFEEGIIGCIELKTESWLWERSGNICIEYGRVDGPSGIVVTTATCWVHQLKRDDETLVWLMFPIKRLKALVRDAIARGRCRWGGDDGKQKLALIPLRELLCETQAEQQLRITIAPKDEQDAARIVAQIGGLLERGIE
jgi:hypothetical protein